MTDSVTDLRDALERLLAQPITAGDGNYCQWCRHGSPKEWGHFDHCPWQQARAALDAHGAGGWLPAGAVPTEPGWYWYFLPDSDQKYPWISRIMGGDGTPSKYLWSRRPIPVPPPPADEGGDHAE